MKAGQASKTAVLVCMGRALAGDDPSSPFSDPTAFTLLPDAARGRVARVRAGAPTKGMREAIERGYLVRQSKIMIARTIAIDDAVRAASAAQVVILGAGLDGRAWRMPELSGAIVFEVDHPDSQREKRARVSELTQVAKEVRFVAVDFARDKLDDALAGAGHDPAIPTTWIWEGVVMYLARRDIEATLDVIAGRSAPASTLVVLYHAPSPMRWIVAPVVRWLGEPLRSVLRPEAMRALLAKQRFEVTRDQSICEIGAAMTPAMAKATTVAKHLRIVTARLS